MCWRRLWRAVGLAAVAVGVLTACTAGDAERSRFIDEVLERRAKHLESGERGAVAKGVLRAERRTDVDALLLLALAEQESHFKKRARGPRGALGLLQVRPSTGQAVCRRHRIPWRGDASLFEPSFNLLIGAIYLAELRKRFGSWDLALTAYNQGPTRAKKVALRGRTPSSRYAARVLRRWESLRQAAQDND